MWAQALLTSSTSIPFPQHDLPTHKCLFHNLTLGHVGEYFQATHILTPFSPAPTSSNTTSVLTTLHPKSYGYFLLFLEEYKLNQDLELFSDSFKLAFQCRSHLQQMVILGWFLNTFKIFFHPEDSAIRFLQSFQLCFDIAQGHIPPQIAFVLGTTRLLTMTKPSGEVCPIVVGETLYRLTSYVLCFQFCEAFATHFFHTNRSYN